MYRANSGLGHTGLSMTFDNYAIHAGNREAIDVVRQWMNNELDKPGVLLFGESRIGKTHLACAVANESINRGVFCRFLPMTHMPREDTEAVKELADPDHNPCLVIDDLGAEKLTDRALECMHIVIDGRLWNGGLTVVTTNHRPERLREILNGAREIVGDRMVGRLEEMCVFVPMREREE